MRDLGAGGATQRQTALVGGVNQQSRAVGEAGSQGKDRGEERGTSAGARAPITTLASGVQWGIKRASPGQHQRKR